MQKQRGLVQELALEQKQQKQQKQPELELERMQVLKQAWQQPPLRPPLPPQTDCQQVQPLMNNRSP